MRRAALAGVLVCVMSVACGCATGTPPADPAAATTPAVAGAPPQAAPPQAAPPAAPQGEDGGGHGQGGHGGQGGRDGGAAAVALPADFPSEVPLPPGTLQAVSGAAGQWSALLLVPGSAADALRSALQFYVADGFTADSPSTAHRGNYTVTLAPENRDHSPTATNLAVGVAAKA